MNRTGKPGHQAILYKLYRDVKAIKKRVEPL